MRRVSPKVRGWETAKQEAPSVRRIDTVIFALSVRHLQVRNQRPASAGVEGYPGSHLSRACAGPASRRTPCRPLRNNRQCESKWRVWRRSAADGSASRPCARVSLNGTRAIMWSMWLAPAIATTAEATGGPPRVSSPSRRTPNVSSSPRPDVESTLLPPGATNDRVTATREFSRS